MEERRGDDIDDINFGVSQHLIEVRNCLLVAILLLNALCQLQIHIADGLQPDLDTADSGIAVAMEPGSITGTYSTHGNCQSFHRIFLS